VISVLGEWLKGRTVILATHRLQLLVWVDRIAVLERGEILIEGPRDPVLKQLKTGISAPARRERTPRATKSSAATPAHSTDSMTQGPSSEVISA